MRGKKVDLNWMAHGKTTPPEPCPVVLAECNEPELHVNVLELKFRWSLFMG